MSRKLYRVDRKINARADRSDSWGGLYGDNAEWHVAPVPLDSFLKFATERGVRVGRLWPIPFKDGLRGTFLGIRPYDDENIVLRFGKPWI